MNENTSSNVVGKSGNEQGNSDPVGKLNAVRTEVLSGNEKRGRGRPPGTPNKKPTSALTPVAPLPPTPETLYKKMSTVWRGIGMAACMATNTTAFALAEDEQKLLGEAYGDVLHELGFADNMAVKIVFLVGTTAGVFGPKVIAYAHYRQSMAQQAELAKKSLDKKPEQPAPPKEIPLPPGMVETKPGAL